MSRKPKEPTGPGSFDAFMKEQGQQPDAMPVQEIQPPPQGPQELLDAILAADWGNAAAWHTIERLRVTYPDFDNLIPAMRIIAQGIQPIWPHTLIAEFVEVLYLAVKHGSFAAAARAALLKPAATGRVN